MDIKIVSAIGGDVLSLNVNPETPIATLKDEIARRKNIPKNIFVLAFQGMELEEHGTIVGAGIQPGDRIYLITRTEGGILTEGGFL